MTAPDKLLVHVFSVHGAQFQLLTQMPKKEVVRELDGDGGYNPDDRGKASLICLDNEGSFIDFSIRRDLLLGYMIGKVPQAKMVMPVQAKITAP